MPTEENQQYILNFYKLLIYPGDIPVPHNIGHVKVYEKLYGNINMFNFHLSKYSNGFQELHTKLCVLYWQLIYDWSSYEDYLDNEKIDNLNKRNFI